MMRPSGEVKVYLHREPIDMRRGRNGLAALVREGMQQDPFASQALYVFIGRRYDTLKILSWDRNGFAVWCGGRGSRAKRSFTGPGCCKRPWSRSAASS
jgi:transposase